MKTEGVNNMSKEPYKAGMIKENIFLEKRDIVCRIVALIDLTLDSRSLELIVPRSRVVLANEIHELLLTDEKDAGPSKTVNHILVIGFFEIETGGVMVIGDKVRIRNELIGEIAGFDVTHMPNHMNVVVKTSRFVKSGAKVGERILISRT